MALIKLLKQQTQNTYEKKPKFNIFPLSICDNGGIYFFHKHSVPIVTQLVYLIGGNERYCDDNIICHLVLVDLK